MACYAGGRVIRGRYGRLNICTALEVFTYRQCSIHIGIWFCGIMTIVTPMDLCTCRPYCRLQVVFLQTGGIPSIFYLPLILQWLKLRSSDLYVLLKLSQLHQLYESHFPWCHDMIYSPDLLHLLCLYYGHPEYGSLHNSYWICE